MKPAPIWRTLATFSCVLMAGTLLPVLLSLPALAQIRPETSGLLVETQNLAGVSATTLADAHDIAQRLLGESQIASVWQAMEAPIMERRTATRRLIVRLTSSRQSFSQDARCLGEALVSDGGGTYAIVYVDRVRQFAQRHQLPLGMALAFAAVHEVGHLLIGNTSHADEGILRPDWNASDALAMRTGRLGFSEETAEQMARGVGGSTGVLAARLQDAEQVAERVIR